MKLPVMPPAAPMLAKVVSSLPAGQEGEYWFEPKWDGFRTLIFRDRSELEIYSRNARPLTVYFPELQAPLKAMLPQRCVLDGELVVPAEGGRRLDFDALTARVHPATSRIKRLAGEAPASFAAFDVLSLGDRDLRPQPFSERRRILCEIGAGFRRPLHLSPSTTSRELAADWFRRFEGAGFDGLIIKPSGDPYVPGKRTQFKLKHSRAADVVVAGFRTHKSGDGPGSLLLGLFDDAGQLHYVGAAGGFGAEKRRELARRLTPHCLTRQDIGSGEGSGGKGGNGDGGDSEDEASVRFSRAEQDPHPWLAADNLSANTRRPGASGRWRDAKRGDDWVPIWGAPVAEVTYDAITAGRFRHVSRLLRWREDRSLKNCTYSQLDQVPPVELEEIFSETGRGGI